MPTLDKDYETRKLMMEFVDEWDSHVYHDITPKKRENKLRKVCDRVAARIGEAIHSTELLSSSKSYQVQHDGWRYYVYQIQHVNGSSRVAKDSFAVAVAYRRKQLVLCKS